ncbi:MAG: flagellar biosynthesis protein FlhF [Bacillota bacterium]|uniref:flagellar biosynthesis protein FlhF n=1 Tax=Virgibacillus TaxID=84406 RepID=UPI0019662363|nr:MULTISPECIES: flagellar biosynthesis protein FlhF [Virgibacillus]MCC2249264.1 flagellar biosynthesis protein FlhF [Virgibacillus sp. AGTR]QRZ17300.1 flagellar biosynthesis protein FlhF [Virgibacillus sp. AGTR]WBX79558.1 flagellar biosynthesis protein FlhF [Virgibacillus salarius]
MKVKKYVADTMPEAMKQVRKELGTEAVILNSREVKKKRFLGLLTKQQIEVIAARDPQPHLSKKKVVMPNKKVESNEAYHERDDQHVLRELRQVKELLHHSAIGNFTYPADFQLAYNYLLEQEVDTEIATSIIDSVLHRQEDAEQHSSSYKSIISEVKQEIENRLKQVSFEGISYDKKLVYFVGPTGVGKTTTIAKVAANSKLNDHKKIAFITTDTYRIAAVEQLKTYAKILNVPVEVAYTEEDFQKAIEKFNTFDLIFVDTAGRNFRDEKYVKQMKQDTKSNLESDTYLVLSLTAKPRDISEIYDQFEEISIKEVILTKIDETSQFGSILNIALGKQIGIGYITNGQDVPEDLIYPSPKQLASFVMRSSDEA